MPLAVQGGVWALFLALVHSPQEEQRGRALVVSSSASRCSRDAPHRTRPLAFLGRAIGRGEATPITDHGNEFAGAFRRRCRQRGTRRRGTRRRLGKVGEHGSIAIVERFMRSMKSECTRRILVPFRLAEMRSELDCYTAWYNEHRPHDALGGARV